MSIDKDFFDDDFEVTYGDELPEIQSDVKDDAYKDVLSALSELDDTQSFDYLEANKTRTINLEQYLEEAAETAETTESGPLEKALGSCKRFIKSITLKK